MTTPMAISHDPPILRPVGGDRAGDTRARRVFPGVAGQVSCARQLITCLLDDCAQVDEIVLVADELICNAIRHTRSGHAGGTYVLDVHRSGEAVDIAVTDQGGTERSPVLRTLEQSLDDLAFNGRGLLTVEGLASQWGWRGDCSGRVVWAVFRPAAPETNGAVSGAAVVSEMLAGLDGAG